MKNNSKVVHDYQILWIQKNSLFLSFFLGGKGGGKNMKNPKSYKTSLELIEMLVLILTD